MPAQGAIDADYRRIPEWERRIGIGGAAWSGRPVERDGARQRAATERSAVPPAAEDLEARVGRHRHGTPRRHGARRGAAPARARTTATVLVWVAALVLAGCDQDAGPTPDLDDAPGATTGTGSHSRLTARPSGDTGASLGYYEYLPPDEGSAMPLLVFLHGYDESGDGSAADLSRLLVTGIPRLIAEDRWPADRPFVVLAPQHLLPAPGTRDPAYLTCELRSHSGSCSMAVQHRKGNPPADSLCTTPEEIAGFLAFAVDRYDVDPGRVYLTGLSCGAFGVYEYLEEYHAARVAAVVTIAGDARPAWRAVGCELGAVPVWAFHGTADDVVDPAGTTSPMTRLGECRSPRPPVEVTVYPGVGHDAWTRTYDLSAGHDVYQWLLGFHRSP